MSRVYIRLLAIAAVVVSVTGASFSVVGLAKLFSGASTSVAFMAGALEFAKLVVTGFLYRYWGHIPRLMRAYLAAAVVVLVGITSMGIYGYLSSAYQQSALGLHTQRLKLSSLGAERDRIRERTEEIHRYVASIPNSHISKKIQVQKEYEGELRKLRGQSDRTIEEISALEVTILQTHAKIGPIIHFAQAIGADPEKCVNVLILLFVAVFDPLAVCLVFSLNLAIRLREKYRKNEVKIAARSLSTPVDHRFRKAG